MLEPTTNEILMLTVALQSYHRRRRRAPSDLLPHRILATCPSAYRDSVPRPRFPPCASISTHLHPCDHPPMPHTYSYRRIILPGRLRFPRQLDIPSLLQDRFPRPGRITAVKPSRRRERDLCFSRVLPRPSPRSDCEVLKYRI